MAYRGRKMRPPFFYYRGTGNVSSFASLIQFPFGSRQTISSIHILHIGTGRSDYADL